MPGQKTPDAIRWLIVQHRIAEYRLSFTCLSESIGMTLSSAWHYCLPSSCLFQLTKQAAERREDERQAFKDLVQRECHFVEQLVFVDETSKDERTVQRYPTLHHILEHFTQPIYDIIASSRNIERPGSMPLAWHCKRTCTDYCHPIDVNVRSAVRVPVLIRGRLPARFIPLRR